MERTIDFIWYKYILISYAIFSFDFLQPIDTFFIENQTV